MLMGEVLSPPRDTLMHTSNSLAMFAPLGCPFRKFGVCALYFGKIFLFSTKEAGILDFLSVGDRCKGLESHINAYCVGLFWQTFRFHFTGERSVPFASAALVDGERFDVAAKGAVIDHFETANF